MQPFVLRTDFYWSKLRVPKKQKHFVFVLFHEHSQCNKINNCKAKHKPSGQVRGYRPGVPPPPPQVKTQVHGPAVRVTRFHGEWEGEQRAACVRVNKPPPHLPRRAREGAASCGVSTQTEITGVHSPPPPVNILPSASKQGEVCNQSAKSPAA